DDALLDQTSGPEPAITQPFALEPGDELVYRYTFDTLDIGHASLHSEVEGIDAAGNPVSDESNGEVDIREKVLNVTLTAEKVDVGQPEEPTGDPSPIDITVTIDIENEGTEALTNVNLRQFQAKPTGAGQVFTLEMVDGPQPDEIEGLPLADIPPGESIQ